MTSYSYAPLLLWEDSIANFPEWKGGQGSVELISLEITQKEITSMCQKAYNAGYKWIEESNDVFTSENDILLTFIKPD